MTCNDCCMLLSITTVMVLDGKRESLGKKERRIGSIINSWNGSLNKTPSGRGRCDCISIA